MINNYLVSIIIPVYNVSQYIERCAVSLFEQTYKNIEYIFVDDCTPDNSIEILDNIIKRYQDRKDKVNVVTNITNRGQASVRNIGVKHCHGEFLMHVDSDDWLDKDVVEKCVEKQCASDADIVAFDRKIHRTNKTIIKHAPECSSAKLFTIEMLRRERDISIWGMLIRTFLYRENNIICHEGINMSEDYQTSPRLAYYAKKVVFVHNTYYHYECRNIKSISATFSEKNVKQELFTIDLLTDFFHDKETDYRNALAYGICKQLCFYRNDAAYFKLPLVFNHINKRLQGISRNMKRKMPLPYKIGLLIKNYRVLHSYVAMLKFVKSKTNIA